MTHRRRQNLYALPTAHWQKLAAPPFNLLDNLDQVDAAIDSNAEIASGILYSAIPSFKLEGRDKESEGAATFPDIGKARSTIRQFYRDWSSEGAAERAACYGPIIEDVATYAIDRVLDKENVRVLVPGAGLGRLVFELCKRGHTVEGNEISYHQLMATSWIFNHIDKGQTFDLYPFALEFNNVYSREHQLQKVTIPDVHVGSELDIASQNAKTDASKRLNITAGDFITIYKQPSNKEAFDVVATAFFIDTAPNLIAYITAIHHCLKPGGQWVNLGPLLWHFGDRAPGDNDAARANAETGSIPGIEAPGSFEMTDEEVRMLVETMGFEIVLHEILEDGGYIQNRESMLQYTYRCSHWVARKGR